MSRRCRSTCHRIPLTDFSEERDSGIDPLLMFLCYLGLIFHFKFRGGYRQVHMEEVGMR